MAGSPQKKTLMVLVGENDNKIKKLNFCHLYAKFCFHFQKINQRECNCDVFVRKLNFMLKIEGFA